MMESFRKWFNLDVPAGWDDVVVSALKVAVVAFIVRQLQDWFEAGTFDTAPNAVDAMLIAGGVLVLNAVHMWATRRSGKVG